MELLNVLMFQLAVYSKYWVSFAAARSIVRAPACARSMDGGGAHCTRARPPRRTLYLAKEVQSSKC